MDFHSDDSHLYSTTADLVKILDALMNKLRRRESLTAARFNIDTQSNSWHQQNSQEHRDHITDSHQHQDHIRELHQHQDQQRQQKLDPLQNRKNESKNQNMYYQDKNKQLGDLQKFEQHGLQQADYHENCNLHSHHKWDQQHQQQRLFQKHTSNCVVFTNQFSTTAGLYQDQQQQKQQQQKQQKQKQQQQESNNYAAPALEQLCPEPDELKKLVKMLETLICKSDKDKGDSKVNSAEEVPEVPLQDPADAIKQQQQPPAIAAAGQFGNIEALLLLHQMQLAGQAINIQSNCTLCDTNHVRIEPRELKLVLKLNSYMISETGCLVVRPTVHPCNERRIDASTNTEPEMRADSGALQSSYQDDCLQAKSELPASIQQVHKKQQTEQPLRHKSSHQKSSRHIRSFNKIRAALFDPQLSSAAARHLIGAINGGNSGFSHRRRGFQANNHHDDSVSDDHWSANTTGLESFSSGGSREFDSSSNAPKPSDQRAAGSTCELIERLQRLA